MIIKIMTQESWSMAAARPVLEEKPYLVVFFTGFLYLTTFGLMNIAMGLEMLKTQ